MSFVLSFRRPQPVVYKSVDQILNEEPGVKWTSYIPIEDRPIQYLEIGCHKGTHVQQIARSYCQHPDSKIYCIDPWEDYDEYPEYKTQQETIFQIFQTSIEPHKDKCKVIRGFSEEEVPYFEDEFFDIIYIDGNHETDYVYRDAILSLQKVKKGGYLVFDDYYVGAWDSVVKGVDMFLSDYKHRIEVIAKPTDCLQKYGHSPQVIVRRSS